MVSAFLADLLKRNRKKIKGESVNPMTDQQKEYAYLADASYKAGGSRGRKAYLRKRGIDTKYDYDVGLSDKHHAIMRNKETGEVVMSIRGTQDFDDVGTDVALAVGLEKHTKRFKQAEKKLLAVKEKYGEDVTLTSHSLGGSISQWLAHKHDNITSHQFNAGASVSHVQDSIFSQIKQEDPTNSKIVNYSTAADPISWLTRSGSTNTEFVHVPSSGLNVHSMTNFLVD